MSSDGEIVRVENLHKYFGKLHVLRAGIMQVRDGEIVVIIGPVRVREKYVPPMP